MKYDLSESLKNVKGEPLKETLPGRKIGEALVVYDILLAACLAGKFNPQTRQLDPLDYKEKITRYKMAKKIQPHVVDLTLDEVKDLKNYTDEAYPGSVAICGAVEDFFEVPFVHSGPVKSEPKLVDSPA